MRDDSGHLSTEDDIIVWPRVGICATAAAVDRYVRQNKGSGQRLRAIHNSGLGPKSHDVYARERPMIQYTAEELRQLREKDTPTTKRGKRRKAKRKGN